MSKTIKNKQNSLLQRHYGNVIHVVKIEDTTLVRGILGERLRNVADVRVTQMLFLKKRHLQIEVYFNLNTNTQLYEIPLSSQK